MSELEALRSQVEGLAAQVSTLAKQEAESRQSFAMQEAQNSHDVNTSWIVRRPECFESACSNSKHGTAAPKRSDLKAICAVCLADHNGHICLPHAAGFRNVRTRRDALTAELHIGAPLISAPRILDSHPRPGQA